MSQVKIVKGFNKPIKEDFHFTHAELHPNSNNNLQNQSGLPDELYLAENTINVLEAIRRYYNVAIDLNGTARTKAFQSTLSGGATFSEHLINENNWFAAVDWDFSNNSNDYRNDFKKQVLTKSEFFKSLLELGLNGIGLYDTFIHIDAGERRSELSKSRELDGYKYAFWDYRESKPELNFLQQFTGNISSLASLALGDVKGEGSDEIAEDFKQSVKKKTASWLIGAGVVLLLLRYASK